MIVFVFRSFHFCQFISNCTIDIWVDMIDDFSRRAVVGNTLGRFDARQDELVLDVRIGEGNRVTECI